MLSTADLPIAYWIVSKLFLKSHNKWGIAIRKKMEKEISAFFIKLLFFLGDKIRKINSENNMNIKE